MTSSGMPRANTSRPSRLRLTSRAAASRIASSRFRRNCSTAASSSPLSPPRPAACGISSLRLEVGEPGGHDEIVGGEFEPDACARGLDEDEILLGERQDGDAGEIDLLGARKVQQQVERPFEAGDVDDQRRVVGSAATRRSPPTGGPSARPCRLLISDGFRQRSAVSYATRGRVEIAREFGADVAFVRAVAFA